MDAPPGRTTRLRLARRLPSDRMVWRPRSTTDGSTRPATRQSLEGLDAQRPVTEALPCHLQSRRWCSKRARQCGQRSSTRVSAATIRRRMAGRLGAGGGPGSGAVSALFPPEPQVLQEGEGEQAQQRVVVQAAPAAPLEVVEPQLVLELLVHLLAPPVHPLRSGISPTCASKERVEAVVAGPCIAPAPSGGSRGRRWRSSTAFVARHGTSPDYPASQTGLTVGHVQRAGDRDELWSRRLPARLAARQAPGVHALRPRLGLRLADQRRRRLE